MTDKNKKALDALAEIEKIMIDRIGGTAWPSTFKTIRTALQSQSAQIDGNVDPSAFMVVCGKTNHRVYFKHTLSEAHEFITTTPEGRGAHVIPLYRKYTHSSVLNNQLVDTNNMVPSEGNPCHTCPKDVDCEDYQIGGQRCPNIKTNDDKVKEILRDFDDLIEGNFRFKHHADAAEENVRSFIEAATATKDSKDKIPCVCCGEPSDRSTPDDAEMCHECFGDFNATEVDGLKAEIKSLVSALKPFAESFDATKPIEEFSQAIKNSSGLMTFTSSIRQKVSESNVSFAHWRLASEALSKHSSNVGDADA